MVRAVTSCLVVLGMATGLAFVSTTFAEEINLVLPENADGHLVVGPEHERGDADWTGKISDGDWSTPAQTRDGQHGSLYAIVTFPESFITRVGYRASGNTHNPDGSDAWAYLYVYVRQNGSWGDPIEQRSVGGSVSYDVDVRSNDNGGLGWPNATGMAMYSEIWACSTGSAGIRHYEMQAWAVPEPSAFVLLGTAVFALLAYAWRKRPRR